MTKVEPWLFPFIVPFIIVTLGIFLYYYGVVEVAVSTGGAGGSETMTVRITSSAAFPATSVVL